MRAEALSQRAGLNGRRPAGREPEWRDGCSSAMAHHRWGLRLQTMPACTRAHLGGRGVVRLPRFSLHVLNIVMEYFLENHEQTFDNG